MHKKITFQTGFSGCLLLKGRAANWGGAGGGSGQGGGQRSARPLGAAASRRACAAELFLASGSTPPALPLLLAHRPLRPWLVVMAAAASLSPEELLPKGGSGRAEELEDELDEEDDDEEVAGRVAAGRAEAGGLAGRAG